MAQLPWQCGSYRFLLCRLMRQERDNTRAVLFSGSHSCSSILRLLWRHTLRMQKADNFCRPLEWRECMCACMHRDRKKNSIAGTNGLRAVHSRISSIHQRHPLNDMMEGMHHTNNTELRTPPLDFRSCNHDSAEPEDKDGPS